MRRTDILAILLAVVGVVRIVSTYHVFNQTTDEPAHIACGMEWLERGTYSLEALHPPLARVATAIIPYLLGIRLSNHEEDKWKQGNEILASRGRYVRNLSAARLGTLPFFLLGTFTVWYWSNRRYGDRVALLAVLLFTTCPVILAHAGLATTDMALAACFTVALYTFVNWLENPTYSSSASMGVAIGVAILCKFSAIVFFVSCALSLSLAKWISKNKRTDKYLPLWYRRAALGALVMSVVLWAGYRFSMGALTDGHGPHIMVNRFLKSKGVLHDAAYSAVESRLVPAPAFWLGLLQVYEKNSYGAKSYLLGKIGQNGWWYFFPVALSVKTPIAFLIFIGCGVLYLGRLSWRTRDWVPAAPVLGCIALIAVCMCSRIDIGVRHILPIYPLFAIIGATGANQLLESTNVKYASFLLAVVLLTWQLICSFLAHPDYLAYFNEFVGKHPEDVLIDSDLDWGQDVMRLSQVLRNNHVDNFSIVYSGTADLQNFDLPPHRTLSPYERTTGWIAISILPLKTGDFHRPNDSFQWLEAYTPVCSVGHSMRLYHLAN